MNQNSQINEQLEALKKQIDIPKKEREKTWEDQVNKLVGLVSNDFASQTNSRIALNEISLITLAANVGNKNAKKKVLKPNIWLKTQPPSIAEEITDIEQRKSAIKSLSSIKADWVIPYILNELKVNQEEKLQLDYLDWLLKQSQTISQLLKHINQAELQPNNFSKEYWVLEIINYIVVQLIKRKITVDEDLIVEIHNFLIERNFEKDILETIQIKVFELINLASNIEPSILLKTKTAALIGYFKHGYETKNKKLIDNQNIIESKIEGLLKFSSKIEKSEIKILINLFDETLKKAIKNHKNFQIEINQEISREDLIDSYEIDNLIVTIISNWSDYHNLAKKTPATEQLSTRLNDLLKKFSITPIGSENAFEPYDPLKHELVIKNKNQVVEVKIIKNGYGKLRPDGSIRVLLKALASDE